jgi:hypothetical protein
MTDVKVMNVSFRYGMGCPGACLHGATVSTCDMEDKDNSWKVIELSNDLVDELQALILDRMLESTK